MAIVIALPNTDAKVTIPYYNSMNDLLDSKESTLKQLSYSFLFFRWILAYADIFANEEYSPEEVAQHLEATAFAYRNELDVETLDEDKLAERVEEIVTSDKFAEKYKPFIENFTAEIFSLFASGALAVESGVAFVDDGGTTLGNWKAGQA